jgi:hypothetical protein
VRVAFRRWRHAGGNDIASLGLIVLVAAVGLGSFAFHALATRGAAVLDVGPIAVFICSYLCLALHRFLRLPALIAVSFVLGFVVLSVLAQRLVPTDILNGSIGYVPALGVMYLVALLALLRARTERPPTHLPAWGTQGTGNARGKLEGYYWRHRPCSRRCSCYDRLILPPAGPFLSGPISFGTCSMPGCSSA